MKKYFKMKKILLIGGAGQLGYELKRILGYLGELQVLNRNKFNYLEFEKLDELIKNYKPNIIVNASAYTNVDKAETEIEQAFLLNEKLPERLAIIAKIINASLIHYSTDYVFGGDANSPYSETDQVGPKGVYGKSKLAGENRIIEIDPDFVILRTAWLYGHYGKNFYKKMIQLGKEKETLKIVNDQIGCPTTARMLATITNILIRECPYGFLEKKGIYHAVSSGQCSWYDFAKIIIENAIPSFQRTVKEIIPVTSEQYVTPAKRPAFSVLNNNKLQTTFQIAIPNWKDLLVQHLEDKVWAEIDE
jgi:dTDP-4-dehydrorhamnose reductase